MSRKQRLNVVIVQYFVCSSTLFTDCACYCFVLRFSQLLPCLADSSRLLNQRSIIFRELLEIFLTFAKMILMYATDLLARIGKLFWFYDYVWFGGLWDVLWRIRSFILLFLLSKEAFELTFRFFERYFLHGQKIIIQLKRVLLKYWAVVFVLVGPWNLINLVSGSLGVLLSCSCMVVLECIFYFIILTQASPGSRILLWEDASFFMKGVNREDFICAHQINRTVYRVFLGLNQTLVFQLRKAAEESIFICLKTGLWTVFFADFHCPLLSKRIEIIVLVNWKRRGNFVNAFDWFVFVGSKLFNVAGGPFFARDQLKTSEGSLGAGSIFFVDLTFSCFELRACDPCS